MSDGRCLNVIIATKITIIIVNESTIISTSLLARHSDMKEKHFLKNGKVNSLETNFFL